MQVGWLQTWQQQRQPVYGTFSAAHRFTCHLRGNSAPIAHKDIEYAPQFRGMTRQQIQDRVHQVLQTMFSHGETGENRLQSADITTNTRIRKKTASERTKLGWVADTSPAIQYAIANCQDHMLRAKSSQPRTPPSNLTGTHTSSNVCSPHPYTRFNRCAKKRLLHPSILDPCGRCIVTDFFTAMVSGGRKV